MLGASSLLHSAAWRTGRTTKFHGQPTHPYVHIQRGCGLKAVAIERDSRHVSNFGFARNFADKYYLAEHLGTGGFGSVYVAVDKVTGERFAVKCVKKRKQGAYLEESFVRRVRHEVDVYNHLGRSLNVAHMYGAYEDDTSVELVMVLCSGGDLFSRIRRGQYTELDAARITREVLRMIAQCHAKSIVIRDIKPDNFLFLDNSPTSPLKAIDFGMATWCRNDELLTDRAGTPIYVSPEVLKRSYGQKTDMWSAGILTYQLLTQRLPFEDEDGEFLLKDLYLSKHSFTNKDVFHAILYATLDFKRPPWDVISAEARDFVQSLLQRDPALRPTAVEALQHPWITQAAAATIPPPEGHATLSTKTGSMTFKALSSAVAAAATTVKAMHSNGNGNGHQHLEAGVGVGARELSSRALLDSGSFALSDTLVQRLQRFGTYGRLKQLALRAVASIINPDHPTVVQLRAPFQQLDGDNTGKISYDTIVHLLSSGDFDLSEAEVLQLTSLFDVDNDGAVSYFEWLAALVDWREMQADPNWDSWVDQVFEAFDVEHLGFLTVASLEQLLCGSETCPIPDTAPAAMRSADVDHDNSISRQEFREHLLTSANDRLELFESRKVQRSIT